LRESIGGSQQRFRLARLIAALLPALSCNADGTLLAARERIAFYSSRDGTLDIFVMDAGGTAVTNLTSGDTMANATPSWSPDGKWIAFTTLRAFHPVIEIMRADGSSRHRLTSDTVSSEWPSWSPGGKIAFAGYRNGISGIYLMNSDGSQAARIPTTTGTDFAPVFSPEGTRIAFTSRRDGRSQVYVMNADGSGATNLSPDTAEAFAPAWSPDGRQLAFTRVAAPLAGEVQNTEVYVMNPDGTGVTRLTTSPGIDDAPSWSPDGSKIAFASERDAGYSFGIYVMNADGSDPIRLTKDAAFATWPRWRP